MMIIYDVEHDRSASSDEINHVSPVDEQCNTNVRPRRAVQQQQWMRSQARI